MFQIERAVSAVRFFFCIKVYKLLRMSKKSSNFAAGLVTNNKKISKYILI